MPADARREPPSEAGHGYGRPPDGPPDEEPWGLCPRLQKPVQVAAVGFTSVVHSALLRSFQNASAVMKSAKVNAHFALERPESFLLGAPRHRCGVCSVKFDSLHLDKEADLCRCCSHSLRIAQFPTKTSTLTAAAACVEWSATVRRLAEDTQMRKVLATRLKYRKDGSDATEYCREAKSLAARADKMTAESTARPPLTQCQPALMRGVRSYFRQQWQNWVRRQSKAN